MVHRNPEGVAEDLNWCLGDAPKTGFRIVHLEIFHRISWDFSGIKGIYQVIPSSKLTVQMTYNDRVVTELRKGDVPVRYVSLLEGNQP